MRVLFVALFSVFAIQVLADKTKSFKKNGVTVNVIDKDSKLPAGQLQKLASTFLTVYPKMMREYNPKAVREVNLIFDPKYAGFAPQSNNTINLPVGYVKENPQDLDIVTFKAMGLLLVPGTPDMFINVAVPGYVTRYQFGVTKLDTQFSMAYKEMASFMNYIEQKHKGTVKKLYNASRNGTYDFNIWKKLTGKTYEEIMMEYSQWTQKFVKISF